MEVRIKDRGPALEDVHGLWWCCGHITLRIARAHGALSDLHVVQETYINVPDRTIEVRQMPEMIRLLAGRSHSSQQDRQHISSEQSPNRAGILHPRASGLSLYK